MSKVVEKTVNLELVGLDGNAFSLMGAFSRQARREKWSQEEIDKVLTECKSGNYDHLVQTLMAHCEGEGSPDLRELRELLDQYGISVQEFKKIVEVDELTEEELRDLEYVEDRIQAHQSIR